MQHFVRQKNEQLVIDLPDQEQPVIVTIVDVRGDKVRVGLQNLPPKKAEQEAAAEA